MNLEALLASSLDGLMLGFLYGLMAMGLTLIFGVMKVINLAHGPVIMLGMFVLLVLQQGMGINPYLGLLAAMALGLVSGILIYFVALHRVINAPELTTLLATFAVNLMIIGLATVMFTTSSRSVDVNLGTLPLGPATLQGTRLAAVAVAVVVTVALYLFLYRSRIGKSIRAVANNRSAAELMGINSTWMLALSFGLGTMLAAVAGGLLSTLLSFTVLSGGVYETKSFVIVVLGGLGNPTGALIGGIVIGLLESVTTVYIPVSWVPVLEYVIFVLILLVAPAGLPEWFKNLRRSRS
ncbi:MAG: branched-chain amino acid ABC transporter permease [Chloroflexi bacterium]|nr:branched-chain amino acid ABC transporter permease [Chloroflexota bacterium]